MSREDLERLDDLGMQAWDQHDPEAFAALFADEFTWRDTTLPEPITTPEGIKEYMQAWFTAFPDMRVSSVNRVVGEDTVAAEVQFTGTHTGPLVMGGAEIPATGKSVVSSGSYFVRVEGDRILDFSSRPDVATMMMQLGLMGQPSAAPTEPQGM